MKSIFEISGVYYFVRAWEPAKGLWPIAMKHTRDDRSDEL